MHRLHESSHILSICHPHNTDMIDPPVLTVLNNSTGPFTYTVNDSSIKVMGVTQCTAESKALSSKWPSCKDEPAITLL